MSRTTPVTLRLLLALVGAVAALVALAGPAAAHAVVVSSSPGDQERLTTAPRDVSITFSEDITTIGNGIQVLDGNGNVVDDGDPTRPDARTLAVGLRDGLGNGTYIASYRVISADGHPVNGGIVFAVGAGSSLDATQPSTGDPAYETMGAVFRFVTYLGALLAAGVAFFLAFIDDAGPEQRTLFLLVRTSAPLAAVGALGTVVAQTALATGGGLGAAGDLSLVRQALVNGLGWNVAVLLVGLAALLIALELRGVGAQVLVFYGALATCASFALWGHASDGPDRWLAMVAAALHVVVAAIWIGGLVALAITLRARSRAATAPTSVDADADADADASVAVGAGSPATATAVLERPDPQAVDDEAPDPYETGRIVARFSTAAAVSVTLLTLAGVGLAWTQLGGLGNLVTTTYGRLLLAKVLVAALVGVVAVYNHQWLLPQLGDEEEDFVQGELGNGPAAPAPRWARLVRTTRLEAAGLVVVLAITAVLVNVAPGRAGQVAAGPFNQTQTLDGGNRLNVVVSPALTGTNNIHLTYSTPTGTPFAVQKVEVQMSLQEPNIGPITRQAQPAGPGHYLIDSTNDLSVAGTWTINVVTRITDFTQETTAFQVPISQP